MSENPLKITFNGPATDFTDAIPIGNGRLGAMVWGGVASETLQLNEDTLWTGIPSDYTKTTAPEALSEVRGLVDSGEYAEATEAAVNLFGNPAQVYQLLGDIKLEFDDSHRTYAEETYHRELDLNTATARVNYSVGDVEFKRECFSSKPDQIVMEGSCPGKRIPPPNMNANDEPKGIQFSAILDIQISNPKGTIHALGDKKLKVESSDWAVLFLVASSSFEGPLIKPADSKKDTTLESLNTLKSIKNLSYSDLYARHLDDYQNLFHRVLLHLQTSSKGLARVKSLETRSMSSITDLLPKGNENDTVSTAERVANLQGIWNKDLAPKWDSAPHLNINLEMNYWPSLPCNLSECQEPLFDFLTSLSINGSKTAQVNYVASGWVVHHKSDIWAKSSADRGEAVWALWPMGGAWLCTHLWEHYNFTLDKDFLKNKAYPLLEGCALFLLDWLIEGHDGYLETNPSTSPEHNFIAPDGAIACVSYSSTMDMAIIKEVFSAIVSAAEVLGKNEDPLVEKVRKAQPRLRPTKIAADGSIMEWVQEFRDPEVHHRHLSHLFGLFPGHSITIDDTPDLCKAAVETLHKRGEEGPGWSTTWKTALWARLHNSEHAYRMVKHLINLVEPDHEIAFEGGLYSNLFAAHPPFQIDANFGFTAAVAEMLVQSTMNDLYLLPALPQDKWPNGCVTGLKARGEVTVNIWWKEGDLHEVSLWSHDQNSLKTLHYRGTRVTVDISSGRNYSFNGQLQCMNTSSP